MRTWQVGLADDRTAIVAAERNVFAGPSWSGEQSNQLLECDLIFYDGDVVVAAWPAGTWFEIYDSEAVKIIKHRTSRNIGIHARVPTSPPEPLAENEEKGDDSCEE